MADQLCGLFWTSYYVKWDYHILQLFSFHYKILFPVFCYSGILLFGLWLHYKNGEFVEEGPIVIDGSSEQKITASPLSQRHLF